MRMSWCKQASEKKPQLAERGDGGDGGAGGFVISTATPTTSWQTEQTVKRKNNETTQLKRLLP
jgi:hypothetical protein